MRNNLKAIATAIVALAILTAPSQLAAQHHHYKLIDVGTFGGYVSSINMATDVNGRVLNMRGVTVGFSATATPKLPTSQPTPNCFNFDSSGGFQRRTGHTAGNHGHGGLQIGLRILR